MIREQEGSPVGLYNGRIAAKFSQSGDAQRSLLFLFALKNGASPKGLVGMKTSI